MKSLSRHLVLAIVIGSVNGSAAQTREWNIPKEAKGESRIGRESVTISRRPVIISKSITYKKNPNIFSEDLDLDNARRMRANQKTAELIGKIEVLIKRERQAKRLGELKMRLAELYYDQSQIIAARESSDWERKLQQWEGLKPEEKAKYKRPELRTPKADRFRQKTLGLYLSLEKASRGRDQGRSQMIRRDDVLFYLASTYMELNKKKQAIPHFYELTRKFPKSQRTYQARLNLADLYFEEGKFRNALPEYLIVVRDSDKQKDENAADVKIYALYKTAWSYFNLQSYNKSIQAFRRTIEESSGSKSKKKILFEQEALADLTRAYAMAGKYSTGESYFKDRGDKEMLKLYQQTAAQVAKDKGHYRVAQYFFGALIKTDPYAPDARDIALEQADLLRKFGKLSDYAKALDSIFVNYGEDSKWLSRQKMSSEEKKALVKELVDLSRREAKNLHNLAQRRKGNSLYLASLPLYQVYFKSVLKPNPDTDANIHEMRFFYAELLYKLGRFPQAAEAYTEIGKGKYETVAAYNRILAYREAAKKDKKYSKDMIAATEEFVKEYPNDKRAGDLLYAGAFEAFQSGSYAAALGTLENVVQKFPGTTKGVEAAERVLFIHERNGDLDKVVDTADSYRKNEALVKAGGPTFVAKLNGIVNNARFKKLEKMPEASSGDQERKSEAFLEAANSFPVDLKEKALNNAHVFAQKSGNKELEQKASAALLAAFPKSDFAKNVYLKDADEAIEKGQFRDAQRRYQKFLATYKSDKEARETAEWNILYIQAHFENVVLKEFKPRKSASKTLLNQAWGHLKKYPNSKNREFIVSLLAFRNGANLQDLNNLKKLPRLSASERALLAEAETVIYIRTGKSSYMKSMVSKNSPARANTALLKQALANAQFSLTEPSFASYSRVRLDFNPARFVTSLKRKLASLEGLEKEYLKVVSYGDGEYALRSLQRISSLYRDFAQEIAKSQDKESKQILEDNYAKPLREKGLTLLRKCFEKAVEFKIAGDGLTSCRGDLAAINPDEVILKDYLVGTPRWIPLDNSKHERSLMVVLSQAFEKNNEGVFLLGVDLMDGAKPPKDQKEIAYIENMSALLDWNLGNGQAAENEFSSIANRSDSELSGVRTAAMKNLAAIRLQVGDVDGAWNVLSSMDENDSQVAEMRGLALVGRKKFEDATENFDRSISKNENNSSAYFNRSLAFAEAAKFKEATESMKAFVSRFNPPMNHLSRRLISEWSKK